MFVVVMNRQQAVKQSYRDFASEKAIISIHTAYDDAPKFNKNNPSIKDILYLEFDDVEEFSDGSNGRLPSITPKDGKDICDFVNKWKNKIECLWVHCDAGVSRSAGVAAAILKATTGDDSKIFDDKQYFPNMLCYRTVLNEFIKED